MGFVKKTDVVATGHCDICKHQCCRSCAINVTCNDCGVTACINCIENDEDKLICNGMKSKLRVTEMFRSKVDLCTFD